ncbi:hypothetical protein CRENBAI_009313 [Crenichthys baileyi]|uniref:Uncharacterized protein n=1 Tax=Crenichthys baileyi TaxID=28760 RepID=A0AAV9QMJ9_9TELE
MGLDAVQLSSCTCLSHPAGGSEIEKKQEHTSTPHKPVLSSSSDAVHREAYKIAEQLPADSSEDEASGSDDDDERLPGKEELADARSSDSEDEEDEEPVIPEGKQEGEGHDITEDAPHDKAEGQKSRNIWINKDNDFGRELPPFLGEWKVNVEGEEPMDFFMRLFPEDLISEIVQNTNLYALQKEKEIWP